MTWYNPNSWFSDSEEKANRAQEVISHQEGSNIGSDALASYSTAFERLESVNRGTSMIVNGCAGLDFDIKAKLPNAVAGNMRIKALHNLLNFAPNPYQDVQSFRVSIFTDFVLEGNIFLYYDGAHLYHLPAASVVVNPDPKTFITGYSYNKSIDFTPDEIIHIKDVSSRSIYRGTSRLVAADRNIKILYEMLNFQDQFFKNGAVTGLIFTSENTLSQVAKDRTINNWVSKYSPKNGAKRPMILDSGLKPVIGLASTFQEMDYDTSVKTHDTKILKALGVPPILLDGGNNANISPNLRLFYLETIMPVVNKYVAAMERYFGYDISPITNNVSALQPDLKEQGAYLSTLVNGGILTPDEARVELRYEPKGGDSADIRIPANIAGSAADPSLGGKPKTPAKEPKPPKGPDG